MKGILKLDSILFVAIVLAISSCESTGDLPSAMDSALPSSSPNPASTGQGPASGGGEQLAKPDGVLPNGGQPY
jgi:hypothetical protein